MDRRALISGLVSGLVLAPIVVRAASLMPIRGVVMPVPIRPSRYMYNMRSIDEMRLGDVVGHRLKDSGEVIWQRIVEIWPNKAVFFGGRVLTETEAILAGHSIACPSLST